MDTSETYIKMCEKAEEIQAQNNSTTIHKYLKHGDYSYWNGVTVICSKDYDLFLSQFDRVIWLPRQDQLQEMVHIDSSGLRLVWRFYDWLRDYDVSPEQIETYDSMEQLWLAFVMKKHFSKIWNGDDWIKQS